VQEVPWKEPEMEEAGARKVAFSDISCFVLFFVQAPSSEPFANGNVRNDLQDNSVET